MMAETYKSRLNKLREKLGNEREIRQKKLNLLGSKSDDG